MRVYLRVACFMKIVRVWLGLCVCVCVCVCVCFVDLQVEEKTCGDGPCLESILEDDVNLQSIIQNIKVCMCVVDM